MIQIGSRVRMTSYGETYTGTVVAVGKRRVARGGRGSGVNQADRNGLNTAEAAVYSVLFDGTEDPAEYRENELRLI